jgi:hypothetical protein
MPKQKISIVLKHKFIYDNYILFANGQVLSLKRNVYVSHILQNHGYIHVYINSKKLLLHRLLAIAFIPNPLNKPHVDHIDGIRSNNDLSNLRWATTSENNQNRSIDSTNKSGYSCIFKTFAKQNGITYYFWQVMVRCKGKKTLTKTSSCKESDTIPPDYVIQCRDEFKKLLHGEFSNI